MYFLLILSLKSILSSIIGSSFYNWFQGTTMGIWFQKQVDRFMQHFAIKYDLELAKTDSKFRKQYPLQADRLDALEEDLTTLWEIHIKEINKHLGKNTKSTIISKGISAGKSQNSYRGLVQVSSRAENARNFSQCDSLLMGNNCGAHTFPYIESNNSTAKI